MAALSRRRGDNGLNAWPGYVDALSTLLMVLMFVLLVFVLAQAFLSVTLSSRDKQLDEVNQELAKLTDMLSLARSNAANLQASIAQLNQQVATGNEVRTALAQRLTVAQGQVAQANQAIMTLTERLATLSDTMRASQQLMMRIAEAQSALGPALQRLADQRDRGADDAARGHLRNIELYMQRLLSEAEQGRAQSTAELRGDLRILTRTVAALAETPHA